MAETNPTSLGWKPRPAVAERAWAPVANEGEKNAELESFAVVDGEWKLIWNTSISQMTALSTSSTITNSIRST